MGATGPIVIRFDSGFWSAKTLELLEAHKVGYTMAMGANTPAVTQSASGIAVGPIAYPAGGEAAVADTVYNGRRLVVRLPDWSAPKASCSPTGATSPS